MNTERNPADMLTKVRKEQRRFTRKISNNERTKLPDMLNKAMYIVQFHHLNSKRVLCFSANQSKFYHLYGMELLIIPTKQPKTEKMMELYPSII